MSDRRLNSELAFRIVLAGPEVLAHKGEVRFALKNRHGQPSLSGLKSASNGLMHCSIARLFDHLVGTGEQCWRDIEPERLRRFEVDDQLELCGLFNGKVCGAFSFWNATDMVACAPE